MDYGQQGFIEVVINSDRLLVEIWACIIKEPKQSTDITIGDLELPGVEHKGMMMNPLIMKQGPEGEIVLFGGYRPVNIGTLKNVFEAFAAGKEGIDIYELGGFKATNADKEILSKVMNCKKHELELNISIDLEKMDKVYPQFFEQDLAYFITKEEIERFKIEIAKDEKAKSDSLKHFFPN